MKQPSKTSLWKSLEDHARQFFSCALTSPLQKKQLSSPSGHILLDYTHQLINSETLTLLSALAEQCQLPGKITGLMRGDIVNFHENKPALHTALRAPDTETILVNGQNIMAGVSATREKIKIISEHIRKKQWLGFSGKPIIDIVNIGIGGSDLGARFCLQALSTYASTDLNYHFISDVDPERFNKTLASLNPETTLFIVCSKSFTTQETLCNMQKAMAWIGSVSRYQHHFIAVTANPLQAQQAGIKTILPIWDWVGGRFSFCSAMNLISAIAIGYSAFSQILAGANAMDCHFKSAKLTHNLPILLALLGIWNNNFLHAHNLLILTYAYQLEQLVPYLQQLEMESNGKSTDNEGKGVSYATAPIVWGGAGNQAQHSYYQLLCQGTHKFAADLITLDVNNKHTINQMCAEKIKVLTEGVQDLHDPTAFIPGQRPINHIRLKDCSPYTIGELIALYEHKVFVQSVIWNINPFNQPGVESAKRSYALQEESL